MSSWVEPSPQALSARLPASMLAALRERGTLRREGSTSPRSPVDRAMPAARQSRPGVVRLTCHSTVLALLLWGAAAAQSSAYSGIGRPATPQELSAWDIDVRPDFKGLPKGSGTVAQGMQLWEAKCASCHGVFGESNAVFSPLVGGTTAADVKSGRVARLLDAGYPGRSTLMKVATLSTLWDYIARAMPWNEPKSLKPDEVYALTAFLLNLGGVLPDSFTLSEHNIAEVQQRMPNRLGMSTGHGLWPGRTMGNGGKPDVKAQACMKNCAADVTVASYLPEHARSAHGNLAEQNRMVGAQHGVDTTRPDGATRTAAVAPGGNVDANAAVQALARKLNCLTCHALDSKLVGPGLHEVAKKYAARPDAAEYLAQKIVSGGSGVWGNVPMPPQSVLAADAKALAQWIATGARP
jgi:S-disulfanyl-L-cysteine oxidoreductase SoxD